MSETRSDVTVKALDEISPPTTRARIVAASFELFLRHGFDGTGLSQILDATGLSKGAFYHYFPSKDAVYLEVIEAFFLKPVRGFDFDGFDAQHLRDSRNILAGAYGELPGAVAAAGIDMARYFALFFEAFSRLDEFRDEMRSYYRALLGSLARRSYEEHEIVPSAAASHAINVIATLEGRLFLNAVFGAEGIGPLLSETKAAE